MIDTRRQRAAELAEVQAQLEARDVRKLAEEPLELMHAVLQTLEDMDHGELKERLWLVRELWRKEVHAYVRKLERGAPKQPARELHAIKRVLAAHGPKTRLAIVTELPDAS